MNPKLLLQFYRGEKIPPLVRKEEPAEHPTNDIRRNISNRFANPSAHSTPSKQTVDARQNRYQASRLRSQIEQNESLRQALDELTVKTETLKDINERLLTRIGQMERQMELKENQFQLEKRSVHNRLKRTIYLEVEAYIKHSISNFTQSLRKQKMSPIVENKLEGFLEQLANINERSVEYYSRLSPTKPPKSSNVSALHQIAKMRETEARHANEMKRQMSASKYKTIFQKLNEAVPNQSVKPRSQSKSSHRSERSESPSFADKALATASRVRPKIFNRQYGTATNPRNLSSTWNF